MQTLTWVCKHTHGYAGPCYETCEGPFKFWMVQLCISYTMNTHNCLPGWINKSYRIWYSIKTNCVACVATLLKKKSALSQQWINTSYSLRRRRSDRSNLAKETHGQNKPRKAQQSSTDYFYWHGLCKMGSYVSKQLCLADWRVFKGFHLGPIWRTWLSPPKWFSMMLTQEEFSKHIVWNKVWLVDHNNHSILKLFCEVKGSNAFESIDEFVLCDLNLVSVI